MTGSLAMRQGGNGNRLRPYVWGVAACLLLLPAVAMQLGAEGVHWTAIDFVAMGVLLAIGCGIYELGAWLSGDPLYRAGFGLAALTGFLTLWVNLAVGMLGDEGDSANLMFAGVLAVAAIGGLLARFRAVGMARAMAATAVAQLAAVAVGVALGYETRELVLSACFALPWLLAAALFAMAAGDRARAPAA